MDLHFKKMILTKYKYNKLMSATAKAMTIYFFRSVRKSQERMRKKINK